MIKFKWYWIFLTLTLIVILSITRVLYMHEQQYQMSVLVTPDNENDPEWPSKRKWFDASKWLRIPQYVKIDQIYLLNIKYLPIEDINDFDITLTLQDAIRDEINRLPELSALSKMDDDDFFNLMKNNISYEYLRTKFDVNTLEPTDDYFLFYFTYKGKEYEVELLRKIINNNFLFMPYGYHADRKGYWHSTSPAQYSYRDYIKGKAIK
ncbi:hypothetical protein UXP06_03350 [Enterobacter ludwigii]